MTRCRKRSYPTKTAAIAAFLGMPVPMRFYRCEVCRAWHGATAQPKANEAR